jgi:hypothetical protein
LSKAQTIITKSTKYKNMSQSAKAKKHKTQQCRGESQMLYLCCSHLFILGNGKIKIKVIKVPENNNATHS